MNNKLFTKCSRLSPDIAHVAEVGVYLPHTSNVLGWIEKGIRTSLFEADPQTAEKCREAFADHKEVSVNNLAIADYTGQLTLYRVGASTFADNVQSSPAIANDGYMPEKKDSFVVECTTFDVVDDGTIDVLSIDIEGGEWNVIRFLRSRPLVISVEFGYKSYVNPNAGNILRWMYKEGYEPWYADGSDVVFAKKNLVRSTLWERWSLRTKNLTAIS
jgi:FkbM family methyltransferase